MFKPLKILDEKNKILRKKSHEVNFPLTDKDKILIKQMKQHLHYSQLTEESEKYNLRPGMGLAFPQLGILKRIIVIVYEKTEGEFVEYVLINPKITSHSVEQIAAVDGEGCLSVNREIDGHVLRYARISVTAYDENGTQFSLRARDELAIAIQHEIDHLDGILFFDKIAKNKPFYTENEIRLI